MRIVQTFWTAGRDPLKYPFGWSHPEYNLMSWALSCLSLREHYDDVALYTDPEGYDVLISKLHLPYTEVNVAYDKNLCLPHHWAYAKIKTYSMQTKPFLHIDGDVYLPHPIPEDIANAPLVAQNREIGTRYYRSMIDHLLGYPEIVLPEFLQRGLAVQSVPSYNMGIFGGSDLDFIHRYCKEAEDFLQVNNMNDLSERVSKIDCNVFFEQILFAVFADSEQREVTTIHERSIKDKGYTAEEFCSLENYNHCQFFHLLGNHKKKANITEMLCRRCFVSCPEQHNSIIKLFPRWHSRLFDKGEICVMTSLSDSSISEYIDFLNESEQFWTHISTEELYNLEKKIINSAYLFYSGTIKYTQQNVRCHPYYRCFNVPSSWNENQLNCLRNYLSVTEKMCPLKYVCVIPSIYPNIRNNFVLQETDMEVLRYVEKNTVSANDIMDRMTSHISEMSKNAYRQFFMTRIDALIKNKIILLTH